MRSIINLIVILLLLSAQEIQSYLSAIAWKRSDRGSLNAVILPSHSTEIYYRSTTSLAANRESEQNGEDSKGKNTKDDDDEEDGDSRFLIKEIEGENNSRTGQFIFSKKGKNGDTPLFAFSGAPAAAPLSDSLIVVGATMGGLFGLVMAFLLSNKDIVPFTAH